VRQLCAALDAVSEAGSAGTPLPADLELPDDETLKPITEAVRALLGVMASGERLGSAAA
jgi:Flp pilus assembly protein TadB